MALQLTTTRKDYVVWKHTPGSISTYLRAPAGATTWLLTFRFCIDAFAGSDVVLFHAKNAAGEQIKVSVTPAGVIKTAATQTGSATPNTVTHTAAAYTAGTWAIWGIGYNANGNVGVYAKTPAGATFDWLGAAYTHAAALKHYQLGRGYSETVACNVRFADLWTSNSGPNGAIRDAFYSASRSGLASALAALSPAVTRTTHFPLMNHLEDVVTGGISADKLGLPIDPTFATDDDLFGSGWSAPTALPTSRNAANLTLGRKANFFFLGDSIGQADTDRITSHFVNKLCEETGLPLRRFWRGSNIESDKVGITADTCTAFDGTGHAERQIEGDDYYAVEREFGERYFGVPVNAIREMYSGTGATNDGLVRLAVSATNAANMVDGPLTEWIKSTDVIRVTPLMYRPVDGAQLTWLASDNGSNEEAMTIGGSAGNLAPVTFASGQAYKDLRDTGAGATVRKLNIKADAALSAKYLSYAGAVFENRSNSDGIGAYWLGGNSWALTSFYYNTPSIGGSSAKFFTNDQVAPWIAACVEPGVPNIIVINLDTELFDAYSIMQGFVTRWDALFAAAGATIDNFIYISQAHHGNPSFGVGTNQYWMRAHNQWIDTLAQWDTRVVRVSLYDMLGGIFGHPGSTIHTDLTNYGGYDPNDANGPQEAWLQANHPTTYAVYPGRNFSDLAHPINFASAKMQSDLVIGELLENAIVISPAVAAVQTLYAETETMQRQIPVGSTDKSFYVRIISSTTGVPETGVTASTAGLALSYVRDGAAAVPITPLSNLASESAAHSDGGLIHVGYGRYRVDAPDAAWAAGVGNVTCQGTATGMIVIEDVVQLDSVVSSLGTIGTNVGAIGTQLSGMASTLDTVNTNVGEVGTAVAGLEDTVGTPVGDSLAADIAALEPATTQPRVNRPAGKAFQRAVGNRRDDIAAVQSPIRLVEGFDATAVSIDVMPLWGSLRVETVGTPEVDGSETLTCTASGPRDDGPKREVMVVLSGSMTSGEEATVTVPYTMETGEEDVLTFTVRCL